MSHLFDKYTGWVWLYKVKEGLEYENQTFFSSNFHKKKKRWLQVFNTNCLYSHSQNGRDPKAITLLKLSPLIILGENDFPSSIYLIDSIKRDIHVVFEPVDTSTTSFLCSVLTFVSDNSRLSAIQNAIIADDNETLGHVLQYCRHTKSMMEDCQFSPAGSALHFTLEKQSIKCIPTILLTLGIGSLHLENLQHQLPIHVAALTSNEQLIKSFIQIISQSYGLKSHEIVNMVNKNFQTALHFVVDEEMIPLMIQCGGNLDAYDSNGYTPFMVACMKKLVYVAIEYLDCGVDVNKPCWENGFTPIMFSCLPGNDDLIKELIDRNADITAVDNYNRTCLHHACLNGHSFSCVLLLNLGINADLQDVFGATALCYATASPDVSTSIEIVALLLARGSYPKIRDIYGRQALHYAAECGNSSVMSTLLENGSDINAVDHNGQTALDIIESHLKETSTEDFETSLKDTKLDGTLNTPTLDEKFDSEDRGSLSLMTFSFQLRIQGLSRPSENGPIGENRSENLQNKFRKYQQCHQFLLSNGAGRRLTSNLPIETNCRDITFSYTKSGTYTVASATPWALISRLTTFPYFSPQHATSLLSAYRNSLEPMELLKLIQLRFFLLTGGSQEIAHLCKNSLELYQLGVYMMNPKDIYTFLNQFQTCDASHPHHMNRFHISGKIEHELTSEAKLSYPPIEDTDIDIHAKRSVSVRMKSPQKLISDECTAGANNLSQIPDKSFNYIQGIDSFVKFDPNDGTLVFRSVYLGKPPQVGSETPLERLINSISNVCNNLELFYDNLFLLCRNKYCQLSNCSVLQENISENEWTIQLYNSQRNERDSSPQFPIFPETAFSISYIDLVSRAAPRLMRGKIIIELKVGFVPAEAEKTVSTDSTSSLDDLVGYFRESISETFASILSFFVFRKFIVKSKQKEESHNSIAGSRLSRVLYNSKLPNTLHSLESELLHHENLPSFDFAMKKLDYFQKSASPGKLNEIPESSNPVLSSRTTNRVSENSDRSSGKSTNDGIGEITDGQRDKNSSRLISSLRGWLQLLTIWCVDFYEDDFEKDATLKLEMGKFLHIVMEKSNEIIENEFDPNAFAPFLEFETTSSFEVASDLEESNSLPSEEKELISQVSKRLSLQPEGDIKRNRVSIVQGSRGSIVTKRLTSKSMAPPKKRGTVLLTPFQEDEYDSINPSLSSSPNLSPSKSDFQKSPVNSTRNQRHSINHRLITRSSSVELSIRSGALSLDYDILELDVEEIAEQITLIQHNIFCRTQRVEFLNSKQTQYNHIKQLTEFSINWMDYMISQILSSDSILVVTNKIKLFLDILGYMHQIRNYFGMFEIVTILETTAIHRLKSAWGNIDPKKIEKYQTQKNLFNPKSNFMTFRQYLKSNPIPPPCMPYVGLYQKDFVSLNQLPNYISTGVLNITKMSSLASKILELNSYQKVPYHFSEDYQIIHILKSTPRYKTEEEQYQRSLFLEPISKKVGIV